MLYGTPSRRVRGPGARIQAARPRRRGIRRVRSARPRRRETHQQPRRKETSAKKKTSTLDQFIGQREAEVGGADPPIKAPVDCTTSVACSALTNPSGLLDGDTTITSDAASEEKYDRYDDEALKLSPYPQWLRRLASREGLLHPDPLERLPLPQLLTAISGLDGDDSKALLGFLSDDPSLLAHGRPSLLGDVEAPEAANKEELTPGGAHGWSSRLRL